MMRDSVKFKIVFIKFPKTETVSAKFKFLNKEEFQRLLESEYE